MVTTRRKTRRIKKDRKEKVKRQSRPIKQKKFSHTISRLDSFASGKLNYFMSRN